MASTHEPSESGNSAGDWPRRLTGSGRDDARPTAGDANRRAGAGEHASDGNPDHGGTERVDANGNDARAEAGNPEPVHAEAGNAEPGRADEPGHAGPGHGEAIEGEVVSGSIGPNGSGPAESGDDQRRQSSAIPAVPVVLVNPQALTGATPGQPPHLGPLKEPKDEPGGAGVPVDPYQGKEQPAVPRAPAAVIGSFPYHVKQPEAPPDPITPYLSAPVKRRRRSEWPVMAFGMVAAAIVMVTCCLAGYGLFVHGHPFP